MRVAAAEQKYANQRTVIVVRPRRVSRLHEVSHHRRGSRSRHHFDEAAAVLVEIKRIHGQSLLLDRIFGGIHDEPERGLEALGGLGGGVAVGKSGDDIDQLCAEL